MVESPFIISQNGVQTATTTAVWLLGGPACSGWKEPGLQQLWRTPGTVGKGNKELKPTLRGSEGWFQSSGPLRGTRHSRSWSASVLLWMPKVFWKAVEEKKLKLLNGSTLSKDSYFGVYPKSHISLVCYSQLQITCWCPFISQQDKVIH